jgi:hypothetical protein
MSGLELIIKAANPLTTGVAIEQPYQLSYPPPFTVLQISEPKYALEKTLQQRSGRKAQIRILPGAAMSM